MIISNTSQQDLNNALALTNKKFGGNIIWNNFQKLSDKRFRVTLKVKNTKGPGTHFSQSMGRFRRTASACWHVHGTFFDALNPDAKIYTAGQWIKPGSEWKDRDVGSNMYPAHMSEGCECNEKHSVGLKVKRPTVKEMGEERDKLFKEKYGNTLNK